MNSRKSGVLLNVSSLPGPFGIGVFGEEAKRFIYNIKEMGFSYWQILPLGNLDMGNSPYCSNSAFAGNYLYIDPRKLMADGLLSQADVDSCKYKGTPYTVDYKFAFERKNEILRKAFKNFKQNSEFQKFIDENEWVVSYAEFCSLKNANQGKSWIEWTVFDDFSDKEYYIFEQFEFYKQWIEIKSYAKDKGIKIIGDMPFYVAYDSVDVYANKDLFLLDSETFKPTDVAGVPPDYFSKDGQLWGNPLYNWKKMEKDGYKWWCERVKNNLKLYDVLRIDHFRAVASFWSVPASAKTAKEGCWCKGPGMKLINAISNVAEDTDGTFIAEDLGVFGEDVIKLLKESKLPGMRVIQFAFDGDVNCTHLPYNYDKNTIAYTGTHDNNTLLGWLWEATPDERKRCLDYCRFYGNNWGDGGYKSESVRAIIETVWASVSNTCIIAFQDMCGFGSDARMNIPGVCELNWRFRTTEKTINEIDKEYFKKLNAFYGRK